jgi:hypothetical protein
VRALSVSLLATLFLLFADAARADGSSADLDVELNDASKSVMSGQVSLGMERIKEIFSQINPISDRILYRKVGSTYLDILYQIEDTNTETKVLSQLLAAEDSKLSRGFSIILVAPIFSNINTRRQKNSSVP